MATWQSGGRLEINLRKVQQNWLFLNQTHIGKTAAVVKANAYGLGAHKIAPALYQAGARQFFVATGQEAEALTNLLPQERSIFILRGAVPDEFEAVKRTQTTPVFHTKETLIKWLSFARTQNQKLPYAIQIDTGMQRLGLSIACYHELLTSPDFLDHPPDVILSHLACAEEKSHPLTQEQIKPFSQIKQDCPFKTQFSLLNTAGYLNFPEQNFDLIRPGIGVYGAPPIPTPNLHPTIKLTARLLDIRSCKTGTSLGYGASYSCHENQKIGILDIGYADGYFRSGSNRAHVFYKGHRCPVVGRISMDLTAINLSSLPEQELDLATPVELLNETYTATNLAQECQTISYEILTSLGNRYQRCYIEP